MSTENRAAHSPTRPPACEHAWAYSNTPGVDICTTCHSLRPWPKGDLD